jgi:outer membrane lipoprotein-sorting protein
MKKISIVSLLFVMLYLYASLSTYAQSLRTPEQILEQTSSSYRQLFTYQDEGWAEKVVKGSDGSSHISTTTFSTFIQRPDKLRRDWHDSSFAEQGRSALTSNRQGINLFLAWKNRYTEMDSSAGSWGKVFGVSGDQTYIVPSIMEFGYAQTTPGPNILASLRELRLLASQEFEGALCYVIAGKLYTDVNYRLWIGVNDHLLRQIEQHVQSLNKVNEKMAAGQKQDKGWFSRLPLSDSTDHSISFREIYREIKINQQINEEVFQLRPPPGAKFVEQDSLFGEKDSFRAVIPDGIKRWLWIPLVLLILSFGAMCRVIWVIRRKKVADLKNQQP